MKRRLIIGIVLCSVASLCFCVQSAKSASTTTPDINFFKAAFEQENSLVKNIFIKSKIYLSVDSFEQQLDDKNYGNTIVYVDDAKEGNKHYRKEVNIKQGKMGFEQELAFDGKVTKGLSVMKERPLNEGDISEGEAHSLNRFMVPEAGRCVVWDTPLLKRLQNDQLQILPQPEEIDGKKCYVIKGTLEEAPEVGYKLWLDPDIGFMARQVEEIGSKGNVTRRHLLSFKEIKPNLWFPQRVEEEGIDNGKVVNRNVFVLISADINNETFSSNIFQITFPPGTRVADRILNSSYIIN